MVAAELVEPADGPTLPAQAGAVWCSSAGDDRGDLAGGEDLGHNAGTPRWRKGTNRPPRRTGLRRAFYDSRGFSRGRYVASQPVRHAHSRRRPCGSCVRLPAGTGHSSCGDADHSGLIYALADRTCADTICCGAPSEPGSCAAAQSLPGRLRYANPVGSAHGADPSPDPGDADPAPRGARHGARGIRMRRRIGQYLDGPHGHPASLQVHDVALRLLGLGSVRGPTSSWRSGTDECPEHDLGTAPGSHARRGIRISVWVTHAGLVARCMT